MSVVISSLCRDLPEELRKYLDYCRSLRFEDKPNYPYLQALFKDAIDSGKYGDPTPGFDWMNMCKKPSSASSSSHQPVEGNGDKDVGEITQKTQEKGKVDQPPIQVDAAEQMQDEQQQGGASRNRG